MTYIFESDRNLDPPYYIYPNDLVSMFILLTFEKTKTIDINHIFKFIDFIKNNKKFQLRTTKSGVHDVFDALRRQSYILGYTSPMCTQKGINYCQDRIADFNNVKPNAAKALEFELIKYVANQLV